MGRYEFEAGNNDLNASDGPSGERKGGVSACQVSCPMKEKMKEKKKLTAEGIRWSSPTQLLVFRSTAYVDMAERTGCTVLGWNSSLAGLTVGLMESTRIPWLSIPLTRLKSHLLLYSQLCCPPYNLNKLCTRLIQCMPIHLAVISILVRLHKRENCSDPRSYPSVFVNDRQASSILENGDEVPRGIIGILRC